MGVFEAREGQPEVIQAMRQRLACDRHAEFARIGEVGQSHPARRMLLAEHHLPLHAVHRAPGPDAPLQCSAHSRAQARMPAQQFLENGDRAQARRGLQHADDLAFPDAGERIGPPAPAGRLLLRGKPGVFVEPVGRGRAEAGLRAGNASRVASSQVHEKPHLTIGDMGARQRIGPRERRKPILTQPPLPPDAALKADAAAAGASPVGLRPPFDTPAAAHSHPDCRGTLTLIVALHSSRALREYTAIPVDSREQGRVYRKIGYGPLVDVFMLDMRSYRAANGDNRQVAEGPETVFLGAPQLAWLKHELKASKAMWKIIAADMPIALIVYEDFRAKTGSEAVAQGDGPPLGRELEIAGLLSFIKHAAILNTVWVTADVHYAAAHFYDPDKAVFQDFEPFWEFVGGPLHASMFGPNPLDNTFGPQAVFVKAPPAGQFNLPPIDGTQFFGHATVDGKTQAMTVALKDNTGATLYSVTLEAKRG